MKKNNFISFKEILNEMELSSNNVEYDIDEQSPLAVSDALRTATVATKEFELIPKLASLFKTSEGAIGLALKKDITTLNSELARAINNDYKAGVRVSTYNILGNTAKDAAKMKAAKEIMSSNAALSEADIVAIIERTKNESKAYARKIETGKIKPGTTPTKAKIIASLAIKRVPKCPLYQRTPITITKIKITRVREAPMTTLAA